MSKAYANERGIAVANLVHASGNVEEAAHEIDVWFSQGRDPRVPVGSGALPPLAGHSALAHRPLQTFARLA